VDHAGPSQPQDQSKVLTRSKTTSRSLFQNNNSWTALFLSETMAALVVWSSTPSTMRRVTQLRQSLSIHTRPKTVSAEKHLTLMISNWLPSKKCRDLTLSNLLLLSKRDLSQSVSARVASLSSSTLLESSNDSAVLLSTTPCFWLVTELKKAQITGLSRTPGLQPGARKVTSECSET